MDDGGAEPYGIKSSQICLVVYNSSIAVRDNVSLERVKHNMSSQSTLALDIHPFLSVTRPRGLVFSLSYLLFLVCIRFRDLRLPISPAS